MNINIKVDKNAEIITALNKYVHQVHFNNHPNIFKEYDYENMLQGMTHFINQEHIKCLLVYNNDEPIGYAIWFKRNYPGHLFKKGYSTMYIDQMCIKPEYQRKGIGRKII